MRSKLHTLVGIPLLPLCFSFLPPTLTGIRRLHSMASSPPKHWLFKSEPDPVVVGGVDIGSWPFSRLLIESPACFDGVRNFQARNILRDQVSTGDLVLYYHSSCKNPGIYGIARVCSGPCPDATALDPKHPLFDPKHSVHSPRWFSVNLEPVRAIEPPVLLSTIKASPHLSDMMLLRQPRLSVQSVSSQEWDSLLSIADAPERSDHCVETTPKTKRSIKASSIDDTTTTNVKQKKRR
jgi:predicted RNA-binding protein with PUA-like domain